MACFLKMIYKMRVLISAGASGLGLAIACKFLGEGAKVHVCDIDSSAIDNVKDHHPNLSCSTVDASNPHQVDTLFNEIDQTLGGLDVLINNVGIAGPTARLEDIDYQDWRRTLEVDLDSFFLCTRLAIPRLKLNPTSSIINISSTAGWTGYPLRSPYATAKWGVVGLSKTMAMELGDYNIRVNCICPGALSGDRMDRVIAAEAKAKGVDEQSIRDGYTAQVSLKTFIDPSDIAETAYFLCSPAAKRISGQTISVDGNTESLRA